MFLSARKTLRILLLLVLVGGLGAGVYVAGCSDPLREARSLEDKGEHEAAIASYTAVLDREPDNADALSALAVNLMLLGRADEALPFQERVVLSDPSDAQTAVELGFNYLRHQALPADAVRAFRIAVAAHPSARNRCFLAQGLGEVGDEVAAEEELRTAIQAEPDYPYAYRLLVGLLEHQGRADEARMTIAEAEARGVPLSSGD